MIPEGYNYAAVDSDGAAYAFVEFPYLSSDCWVRSSTNCKYVLIGKYFNNKHWKISLITRDSLPKIPLKTLTVNDIPHGYFWAAVEPDGVAYAFGDMPNLSVDYNSWQAVEGSDYTKIGSGFDSLNWKKSLISSDENVKVFFENPTSDDIPEGFNYIAVDNSGSVYAFIRKPLLESNFWKKTGNEPFRSVGIHLGEFDWKNSLVFRPYNAEFKTLTVEDIPEGFNFAAVDYDGLAYAYVNEPWLDENEECWKAHDFWQMSSMFYLGSDYDIVDFKNSLVSKNESDLKQLTVDDIPNGYSYAAVNSDGFAFAYKEAPVLLDGYHDVPNKIYSGWREYCKLIGYGYDVSNWENSLVSKEEIIHNGVISSFDYSKFNNVSFFDYGKINSNNFPPDNTKTIYNQIGGFTTGIPNLSNKFSSFDITFLEVAEVIAKRSKSTRLKVGAVLVKDNRIIATGYNGLVSGAKPDVLEDENGVTKKEVIHAELNCIISCARNGVSCEGSTLYLTHSPCESCAALIAQSGVKKVIFKEYYRDLSGVEKLKSYGVEVV